MKQLMFSSKIKLGSNTDKPHNCIRLTHLIRPLQKNLVKDTKQEGHYLREISAIYKLPVNLTKLDKVLSSDRVYSNHALSWHLKSLCLGLVFAFSLNSVMKSLHLTIVILQQNKKGETMTGLLKDNPNALALYPKCTKKETGILSSEDYDKLIKHCIEQATQWDMLIIFFLCIGARLGEGLGLQWSKINFDKHTIRIDQQMQSVPNKDKNSKYKYTKKIIDSTKTKSSNRTLPMSSDVERILRHVKKLQAENKMAQGAKYHRDLDLVFAREDGYFICDTTFRAFVNKRLAEAGIEHHKIHSFRHSCATNFFEQKADIKKVSKWLGHSNIGTTLDTYTHPQLHHLEELAELQSKRFKRIFNSNEKDIPEEMLPEQDDWGA